MNSYTICCSLFLGLILVSQSPIATDAVRLLGKGGARGTLISVLCATAINKVECDKILSNPQIMQCKNYKQLSKALAEIGHKKAAEGQAFLKGIAAKSKSPALTTCAGFAYDGTVMSFQSCMGSIDLDPQTASYDCKVAGDGPDLCDRAMAEGHIVNPAVTALNSQILFLSQLSFRATNNI